MATWLGRMAPPVPVYQEAAQIGREFAKAGDAIAGTLPDSEVAILQSYDSRWAINQRHDRDFDPLEMLLSYYQPLRTIAQQMDLADPMAPLAKYKLAVAPGLNVLPEAMAEHLREYVEGGGYLMLGPRSGMKDEWNGLNIERQPGRLVPLLGGRVEQYYALDGAVPVAGSWGSGEARIWAEQLGSVQAGTKITMKWGASNGWLDGQPAVITRSVGKGRITYIGGWFDETLMQAAAKWMLSVSGVEPALGPVPEGVEVCRRTSSGRVVFVLINHTTAALHVTLPKPMTAVLGSVDGAKSRVWSMPGPLRQRSPAAR